MYTAQGLSSSPWDSGDTVLAALLGAEVPIEGGARQNEGCEAGCQHIEEAVHSAVEWQCQ